MKSRCTAHEWDQLLAYVSSEPLFEARDDLRTAHQTTVLVNLIQSAIAGRRGRAYGIEDFLLRFGEADEPDSDPDRLWAFVERWVDSHNANVVARKA